jgi:hypothetical protein
MRGVHKRKLEALHAFFSLGLRPKSKVRLCGWWFTVKKMLKKMKFYCLIKELQVVELKHRSKAQKKGYE